MNIAMLIAGGSGTRTNQDIPKQFIHIENKPLIIYTLEAFEKHPEIGAILVVCLDGWQDVLQAYANQFNITKLKWIVAGGENGQESIFNGLSKLRKDCNDSDVILIHDAIRPLISSDIISDNIAKCNTYGGAVTVIPCVEAILQSDNKKESEAFVPRETLWRTQTPQTYPLHKLLWAHGEAKKRNITDTVATCTLMVELGETIYFSDGSEKNIKITTAEDFEIFKALLNSKKEEWLK